MFAEDIKLFRKRFNEPDKNNKNNYVFDTSVINNLAHNVEHVQRCEKLMVSGHCYFITEIQFREIGGFPDRTWDYMNLSAWKRPDNATEMFEIMERLNIEFISCTASLRPNFTSADGNFRRLENSGERIYMFDDIFMKKRRYLNDAQIAEAAMYHDCILIANDKRLRNKVNRHFPKRAISFDEYFNNTEE